MTEKTDPSSTDSSKPASQGERQPPLSRSRLLKSAAIAGSGALGLAALSQIDSPAAEAAGGDRNPAYLDRSQRFSQKQTFGPIQNSPAINLAPAKTGEGPPPSGRFRTGDVFVDGGGVIWYCLAGGNDSSASWIPLGPQPQHAPRVTNTVSRAHKTLFSKIANSTLQGGHDWVAATPPGGQINLAYRKDGAVGPMSIFLKTGGGGGAKPAIASLERHAPIDLTGKMVRLWFKIIAADNFARLRLYVGSGGYAFESSGGQTIIGYDDVNGPLSEYAKPGEWVSMTVTASSFIFLDGTLDWTQAQDFRVQIEDLGAGPCSLLFGGMEFVELDSRYPNGVISLCFDDCFASHYSHAMPYLERYGFVGTQYAISDVLGGSNYMSLEQLLRLQNVNGWEVASHSFHVADHNAKGGFTGIGLERMLGDVGRDKMWMAAKGFRGVNDFAWPQGFYTPSLRAAAEQAFSCARTTDARTLETLPVGDAYRLRSLVCTPEIPAGPDTLNSSVQWYISRLKQYGGWFILTFHDLVKQGTQTKPTQYGMRDFESIVDYIAGSGIPVRTVGDVLEI